MLCLLGTESEGSHADEPGISSSSSSLHYKLGRLTYHVTHKLADVIARLNDWQRTLDDMLQVSTVDKSQAVREAATIYPRPCKLTFDLLTLKVVPESCVTWATSVPILVSLGLSVLDLGPMYATDRRQTRIIA